MFTSRRTAIDNADSPRPGEESSFIFGKKKQPMAAYGYLFGGGGVHHIYRLTTDLIEYYFSFNFVTRVVTHK